MPTVYRDLLDGVFPLTTATLKVWDIVNRMLKLAPVVSPLALLRGLPGLPTGEDLYFFSTWGGGNAQIVGY